MNNLINQMQQDAGATAPNNMGKIGAVANGCCNAPHRCYGGGRKQPVGTYVFEANQKLRETKNTSVSVINCRYIKPMDTKLIDELSNEHQHLITLEEGVAIGGFGSMVLDYVNSKDLSIKVHVRGIDDRFIEHGTRDELLADTGLDVDSVYNIIANLID